MKDSKKFKMTRPQNCPDCDYGANECTSTRHVMSKKPAPALRKLSRENSYPRIFMSVRQSNRFTFARERSSFLEQVPTITDDVNSRRSSKNTPLFGKVLRLRACPQCSVAVRLNSAGERLLSVAVGKTGSEV